MAFQVTLQPSAHRFEVDAHLPLLSAGLKAGNFLPYSCRQGSCGTCKGRILAGTVAYGDVMPAYLSDEERSNGGVLLCQATATSDLVIEVTELTGLAGVRPRIVPCRVTAIEHPTPEVAVLQVRLPMNENMRFLAGQYVDFILDDDARRSFSIASVAIADGVTSLEFHLKRLPGGRFTDRVFGTMKLREILSFEGPLGTFFIREGDKPLILAATGTGFAPIRAMVNTALAVGRPADRPIAFYWGARTPDGLYALDEARAWAAQIPSLTFIPLLSGGRDDRVAEARAQYVQDAVRADFPDLSGHEVYACGSPAMVTALRTAVTRHGLPASAFFSDEFLPAAVTAAPIPALS